MKKLLLILPIILCGCASGISDIIKPSETIRNEKCVDIEEFEIFQVINGGALAFACEVTSYNDCRYGQLVFVPNQKGEDYYDGKRIKAPAGKCIIYEGVFKYVNKQDVNKTVPKLKIIDSQIPNPAYAEWLKNQDKKANL